MKTEELQALGLDEDQIKKVFELNGRDIKAEKQKTEKIEADRDQWKSRAETAEETLKGFDGVDVDKLNSEIADWKKKAESAEKEYQKQIYDRDFSDALNNAFAQIKFSSEAAKKAIMGEVKEAGLKLKDGTILGLNDLISQIKERDASAFETDKPGAKFTEPPKGGTGSGIGFDKMSLAEKMRFANEHPESADVVSWLKK